MKRKQNDNESKPSSLIGAGSENTLYGDTCNFPAGHDKSDQNEGVNVSLKEIMELKKWVEANRQQLHPMLDSAPGFRLSRFLKFVCPATTMERVIEPMHAEFLAEYLMALKEDGPDETIRLGWLRARMRIYMACAVIAELRARLAGRFKM